VRGRARRTDHPTDRATDRGGGELTVGLFKSERLFPTDVTDLEPIALNVATHFQGRGYEVVHQHTAAGAWDIDITRTGVFRSVSGMRTALKVRIEPAVGGVVARAGIGILGQQALPTVVSMVVFWPVLVTQVWGAVQSSKLDDEALRVVADSLTPAMAAPAQAAALAPATPVCPACGTTLSGTGKFCTGCGARLA
jgi:hypothetical protein